ncbi:MAG: TonB C-terminal domain-containing protein [Firmicutes bacterium]|nr:TonB C-terminal domain-containing protein [Bacillota bacterium]
MNVLGVNLRPSLGMMLSGGLHVITAAAFLIGPRMAPKPEEVKVTWVTLPAMGSPGPSGGSAPLEKGTEGERVRRVEDVAPQSDAKGGVVPPNAFGTTRTAPAKGTNPDASSMGKATTASKGANPTANPVTGAAGKGTGGGLGEGTGIPGLKASGGVQGGVGLIGDLDGSFPFTWYLQQIQNRITSNWNRVGSAQGRVQIYFRIRRDGGIEAARVESPSGNAMLDQSALLAVRRSDPLPRLPESFDGSTLGVRFWFTYLGN